MIDGFLTEIAEGFERELTSCTDLLSQPSTLVPFMWSWARRAFERLEPSHPDSLPLGFAEALSSHEVRASVRRRLDGLLSGLEQQHAQNEVFHAFRDLARSADAALPGSSLLAFAELCRPEQDRVSSGPLRVLSLERFFDSAFGHGSHLHHSMRPLGLFTRLDAGGAEEQAATTMRALGETIETLSRSQLRVVIMLARFAERRWPRFPAELGALTHEAWTSVGSSHPALVDRRLVTVRNANAHGHWMFVPASNTVHYWDRSSPGVVAMPLVDLKQMLGQVFGFSGLTLFHAAVVHAARAIFFDAFFLDFLDEIAHGLQAEQEERRQAGQRAWEAWMDAAFRDLRTFVAQQHA